MHILIADDDALIRKWLSMLLNQVPGREITVATAENGIQALQSIESGCLPDLLITDIKMPQMDGLALCQQLKQRFPHLPIVILSSYEEFSLVKRALQLGALDYILKASLCLEDISNIIKKAEDYYGAQSSPGDGHTGYAETKRQLLESYLAGGGADDHTFLLRLDARLTLDTLALMMLKLDRNIDGLLETLQFRSGSNSAVVIPYTGTTYIAFLHCNGTPAMPAEQKKAVVKDLLVYLRQQESFSVEAWATMLNCNETGIYVGIQACQSVLDFKYYYSLEDFETVPYRESGAAPLISGNTFYKKFFEVAGRFQIQDAAELLRKCLDVLHSIHCHPTDIERYMSIMCHKLLVDVSMLEIEVEWFNQTLQQLHEVENAATQSIREDALMRFLAQYSNAFSAVAHTRSDAVLGALKYIDEHYSEKITLDHVAAQSHMNSTYMSELFKKEMGVTLIDYINNLRIIHACEYLRFSNCSMGQIAERCGFNDQNYFTKVFKKFLNTTPSQYRSQLIDLI